MLILWPMIFLLHICCISLSTLFDSGILWCPTVSTRCSYIYHNWLLANSNCPVLQMNRCLKKTGDTGQKMV